MPDIGKISIRGVVLLISVVCFGLAEEIPVVQSSTTVPTSSAAVPGVSAVKPPASQIYFSITRFTTTQSVLFGQTVDDPYRWLEDGRSEEVQAWVTKQNRTVREYLTTMPIRPALRHRLKALMDEDEVSVPQDVGGRLFFTRRATGKDKPTLYWSIPSDENDHVLLKPQDNEALGEWYVSPDGQYVAYQLKKNNSDEAVIHVRHVDDWHERPEDVIPGANFADLSWAEDSKGFYYTRLPIDSKMTLTQRVAEADVRFHKLGTPYDADPMIFPKTRSPSLYLSPSLSRDGDWLFVSVINGWTSNNIFFKEVRKSSSTFKPLFMSTAATAQAIEWGGILYLRTNEGAPNGRIVNTFIREWDPSAWKEIVPERPDTIIQSMNMVGGYLVLTIMRNAMVGIEVRNIDGKLVRTALAPLPGHIREISGREYSDSVYYAFDSVVVPTQIYRVVLKDGTTTRWSIPHHPIDPNPYQAQQVKYRSKDGTTITMFVVERKGLPMDGSVPFLLVGYGGFGEPTLLRYNPMVIPWLEAGGGVALPNIRGGGEYGEAWHRAGMLTQKQNTIDDFIAGAEYLIDNKYTSKERLVIHGVSNGALLMGAAMTQRPELFRAVVCKSPLFDMIRYPLFGEGPAWIPEYGSPEVESEARALLAYSPYHHVRSGIAYPGTLIISPENDDRVDPMHARKMTAALQSATTSYHPILFEAERKAGHEGSDSKEAQIEDYLDRLSFLMNSVRLRPAH